MSASSCPRLRATLTAGRLAVLAATCAGAWLAAAPAAWAQASPAAAQAPRTYQIAAGPLGDALTQFARSAGVVL